MEITKQMEIDMISNPDQWPGDTLCLKQRAKSSDKADFMGYKAFGVITNSKLPITVYLRPDFAKERHYDTVQALLDDGWIVD